MVGLADLFYVYQNSGPALLFGLIAGGTYIWKQDLQPRLRELETTQQSHGERWQEHALNAQERTLLLDDVTTRVEDVEDAQERLNARVREIEQKYAIEHFDPGSSDQGGTFDDGGDHD